MRLLVDAKDWLTPVWVREGHNLERKRIEHWPDDESALDQVALTMKYVP